MAADSDQQTRFDAGSEPVAVVYAKALLGALEATGQTDEVLAEFQSLIVDCFDGLPQFEATLGSPRVPHGEKVALLHKAFQSRMTPVLLNFLKVASQHGRLNCLRAIQRAAQKLVGQMRGRVEVEVATATPIDPALEQQVVASLQAALGKPIDLSTRVRPELIGGLLVRIGDSVYDASVLNQLRRLREDALESATSAIQMSLERFAVES
jgi:F-type H+-transporting ATPase subunit delta